MLKASQPEEKQPVTQKHQDGAVQKKEAREKYCKNISKNNDRHRQTHSVKELKHKNISNCVVPKDSQVNLKLPAVSEAKQASAPLRKRDGGKSNGKQEAKRKKSVVEEKKPTEYESNTNILWFQS